MDTRIKPLSYACHVNMGQSPDSANYNQVGNGLPFFQGNADFGILYPRVRYWCTHPKKIAKIGDILISVRAPIGALNMTEKDCCIGRGLASLTAKEGISTNKYLFYVLQSRVSDLIASGTGSTFKAISKGILENTFIPVPSIKLQNKIVAILDKSNELIYLQKKQINNINKLVKSQFVGYLFFNTFHA
jgi:type I restriction enzyme S subunit